MQVRDGMSGMVLTIGPGHTLREASRQMSQRRVARRSCSTQTRLARAS